MHNVYDTHTHTEQSTYSQSRSSYLQTEQTHFISTTKRLVRLYKPCRTAAMKCKSPWIGKEAIIIHQASILKKTTQISKNIQPLNPSLAHPRSVRLSSLQFLHTALHTAVRLNVLFNGAFEDEWGELVAWYWHHKPDVLHHGAGNIIPMWKCVHVGWILSNRTAQQYSVTDCRQTQHGIIWQFILY